MALVRWEPVRELGTIQSEMNRLFNSFFDTPTHSNGATLRRWVPAMDLTQTEDAYVLKADLPGLSESDVHIEFENDVLTVSGERKSSHEDRKAGYHRVERSHGSFRRSVRLPQGVDADAITASFDKGVLEITVPKPEAAKPHKVQITVAGGEAASPAIESGDAADAGSDAPEAAEQAAA